MGLGGPPPRRGVHPVVYSVAVLIKVLNRGEMQVSGKRMMAKQTLNAISKITRIKMLTVDVVPCPAGGCKSEIVVLKQGP